MAEQNEQNEHPDPGQQGRATHSTGSTTQGGSNFGQGSSHLGGESYQQGNVSNKGANYENETDKLGSSTTGTNNEGSSSPRAGGDGTEQPKSEVDKDRSNVDWNGDEERNDTRRGNMDNDDAKKLFEGDRRDTSLEQSSGLDEDKKEDKNNGTQSRGWSSSTVNNTDGPINKS